MRRQNKQPTFLISLFFSKQNLAVLVSNLNQLPSQLTRVYRRSVLLYFLTIMGNISTKCLRNFSHHSLTFKAPCMPKASNFLSKIVTQSTEKSKSKLHPGHLFWSLSTHSFYCFSAKPHKKVTLSRSHLITAWCLSPTKNLQLSRLKSPVFPKTWTLKVGVFLWKAY